MFEVQNFHELLREFNPKASIKPYAKFEGKFSPREMFPISQRCDGVFIFLRQSRDNQFLHQRLKIS